MCDEGETADRADAVRTESQKMESRAGETALDGSARSIIVLIVVGMLVGVLSGTFGIGGGTVIVPALVWLGLSQRNAAATSTLAIVPTSISGVVSYATGGHVDWLAAVLLFCGMFVSGQIGSWLLSRLSEVFLRWFYVVFLCFVIVSQICFTPSRDSSIALTPATGIAIILVGVFIGTLAGLLGIGGGAIAVPSLSLIFGASDLIARGTSLLAMFPSSITATVANSKRNLVIVKDGLVIGIVSALSAPLGTMIAGTVSPRVGTNLFTVYLVVIAARCLWTALKITPAARGLVARITHGYHTK